MSLQETSVTPETSIAGAEFSVSRRRENLLEQFEREVQATYPAASSHPYHNWEHHIPDVLGAALKIAEHLEKIGVKVDRDVIKAAVLGHDAGYGYDHRAMGFRSKEELAADLSEKILLNLGSDAAFAARVALAIRATEKGVELRSVEEKILRAADLSGLAGEHEAFLANSKLLHVEYQNARAERSEYASFFRWQVDQVLSGYLATMIQLTPDACDLRGRSLWHQATVGNILKTDWQAPVMGLFDVEHLPVVALEGRQMIGDEIMLASAHADSLRSQLDALRAFSGRNSVPALVVPGRTGAVSFPDQCCSEVHLRIGDSMDDVHEAVRVARDGATLSLYIAPESACLTTLMIDSIQSVPGIKGLNQRYERNSWQVLTFEVAH